MFKYLLENKDTSIIIELIENTNIDQIKKTITKYPQVGEEKKKNENWQHKSSKKFYNCF